ncbi:hypothetical protein [Paenibacillus turpanensis]|uniref:hypothetical protein n=1 Tax=Paenibacillus turpanensis TaxID=2689078 RepID=UPI00140AF5DF|nr:hypothetical protein [Paenibacillus turpanensis]
MSMKNSGEKMIEKKAWCEPELQVLDMRETNESTGGGYWQFIQEGEFWKRTFVDS